MYDFSLTREGEGESRNDWSEMNERESRGG
jgi:hypothetical protein